jgi:hypothetical protein
VAVVFLQDAVEQRCLAAAQEAGEDGDGNGTAVSSPKRNSAFSGWKLSVDGLL